MKKAFTLLELIIVIIILGVLATLGIVQYTRMIEKARGAEARQVLGAIRTNCAALYLRDSNTSNCTAASLGIGSDYPTTTCTTNYYFKYSLGGASGTSVTSTATRCTTGGKTPDGATADTVSLTSNFSSGADNWTSSGMY